jgi:hypothetical protein
VNLYLVCASVYLVFLLVVPVGLLGPLGAESIWYELAVEIRCIPRVVAHHRGEGVPYRVA